MKEKDEMGDYMETTFFISKNTSVTSKQLENEVIGHACKILQRDILTVVTDTRNANEIELVLLDEKMKWMLFIYFSYRQIK